MTRRYSAQALLGMRRLPQCNERRELLSRADVLGRGTARARPKQVVRRTEPPASHRAPRVSRIGRSQSASAEEDTRQRTIKSLLNKLTPEKFDTIAAKLEAVDISATVSAQGLVGQVLDKALAEPTFCPLYARLCRRLGARSRPLRDQLVVGCLDRFEEVNEGDVAARTRSVGIMHTIAAMHAHGLLTSKQVHMCLRSLSRSGHVESLAQLLRLTGARLDVDGGTDGYIELIGNLSRSPELDSRLRFMLRDVIDARNNGWVERRKVEGPKMLSAATKAHLSR